MKQFTFGLAAGAAVGAIVGTILATQLSRSGSATDLPVLAVSDSTSDAPVLAVDGNADVTGSLQAALDSMADQNGDGTSELGEGGTVRLPAGKFRISHPVTVGQRVNLVGAGPGATVIELEKDGQLRFCDLGRPRECGRGGTSGDFMIQPLPGAELGHPLIYVGTVVERKFSNIYVRGDSNNGSASHGMVIEGAQNTLFENLVIAGATDTNLTIGSGAANLTFVDTTLKRVARTNLRISDDATRRAGPTRLITFYRGIFEGMHQGDNNVHITGGYDVLFDSVQFNSNEVDGRDHTIVLVENERLSRGPAGIKFRDSRFQFRLRADHSKLDWFGVHVRKSAGSEVPGVTFSGQSWFRGGDLAVGVSEGAVVRVLGELVTTGVDTQLHIDGDGEILR